MLLRSHTAVRRNDSPIKEVPDEVMIRIFSYVKFNFMLNKLAIVCTRWNKLSKDPSNCKETLILNYEKIKIRKWRKIMHNCRYVKRLSIEHCKISNRSPINYIKNLRQLQSLDLRNCHFMEIKRRIFEPLINKGIPSIKFFTLNNCTNTNEFLKQIADLITLKFLEMINYDTISSASIIRVLENCINMVGIRIIKLKLNEDSGDFKNKAVNSIFRIRSRTLQQVALHVRCNDDSFINLEDCLNIRSLLISNCKNVSDDTLFRIMKLRNLKKLFLSFCSKFTTEGFEQMFNAGEMKNLTILTIWLCSGLSNSNLKSIVNCCPKLVCFHLIRCKNIDDDGIEFIVDKCSALVHLEVRKCKLVTGKFLSKISANNLKKLKELSLNKELENIECVNSLKKIKPSLKLLFDVEKSLDEYF